MYPRLLINLDKIKTNVKANKKLTDKGKLGLGIVTKSFTADQKIVKAIAEEGVDFLADSRTQNLKSYSDIDVMRLLLRLPQLHHP